MLYAVMIVVALLLAAYLAFSNLWQRRPRATAC